MMKLIKLAKSALIVVFFSFLFIGKASSQCYTANAGSDVTICSGGATIGTSSISGYTYTWSPTTGLNNPSIAQPSANPGSTTTYTLTTTPPDGNLLTDGGFENGNLGSFSTDYGYCCVYPYGANGAGTWNIISGTLPEPHTGTYAFWGGAPYSSYPPSSQRALYKTLSVNSNTTYTFSGYMCTNYWGIPVEFEIKLIGNASGTTTQNFTTTSTNNYTQFSMNYISGSNTAMTIEIRALTADPAIFCLDDLKFNCAATTDQVTVTVGPSTPAVTPAGPITYYNHYEHTGSYVLTSTPAPSYQWYKNNVSISGATNQTFAIPISGLGNTADYYKCVTSCGTSNTVLFQYIGCYTNSGYPVSVPTSGCYGTLTGMGISLPTYSLGSGTTYSHTLEYSTSCLYIASGNKLKDHGCGGDETNFILSKSSRGTEELIFGYYFFELEDCLFGGNGVIVSGSTTPLRDNDENKLSPNPANYAVTIRSKEPLLRIQLYNEAGNLIKTLSGNNQPVITLDISDLKPGIYVITLIGVTGAETKKLVIQ